MIDAKHWHDVDPEAWIWPNFTPSEMACRGTGMLVVSSEFMDNLQRLRHNFALPMHVTSGCRSVKHNERIGGKSKSFHICDAALNRGQQGCLAVDVAISGADRGRLFAMAWSNGWAIGWSNEKRFLHLDRRVDVGWKHTTFGY